MLLWFNSLRRNTVVALQEALIHCQSKEQPAQLTPNQTRAGIGNGSQEDGSNKKMLEHGTLGYLGA